MFKNLHLASYVNQLGLKQQQEQANSPQARVSEQYIHNGRLQLGSPSQYQLTSGRNSKSLNSGLPRQQPNPDSRTQQAVSSDRSLNFMAVGSQLNMQTYAKKESYNLPSANTLPGLANPPQKALEAVRKSQLKLLQQQKTRQQFVNKPGFEMMTSKNNNNNNNSGNHGSNFSPNTSQNKQSIVNGNLKSNLNSDLPIAAIRKNRKNSQNRHIGQMASKRADSSVVSTPKNGEQLVVYQNDVAENQCDEQRKVENQQEIPNAADQDYDNIDKYNSSFMKEQCMGEKLAPRDNSIVDLVGPTQTRKQSLYKTKKRDASVGEGSPESSGSNLHKIVEINVQNNIKIRKSNNLDEAFHNLQTTQQDVDDETVSDQDVVELGGHVISQSPQNNNQINKKNGVGPKMKIQLVGSKENNVLASTANSNLIFEISKERRQSVNRSSESQDINDYQQIVSPSNKYNNNQQIVVGNDYQQQQNQLQLTEKTKKQPQPHYSQLSVVTLPHQVFNEGGASISQKKQQMIAQRQQASTEVRMSCLVMDEHSVAVMDKSVSSNSNTPQYADRAQTSMSGGGAKRQVGVEQSLKMQLVKMSQGSKGGSSNAEGGIITTLVHQRSQVGDQTHSNKRQARGYKSNKTMLQVISSDYANQTVINATRDISKSQSPVVLGTLSAREDQKNSVMMSSVEENANNQQPADPNNNSIPQTREISRSLTGPLFQNLEDDRQQNRNQQQSNANLAMSNTTGNFSHIERKQQQALLGLTGNTLSQLLTDQCLNIAGPSNQNQWLQKAGQIIQPKKEKLQIIGSHNGMKGSKLAKNSKFVRMQGFYSNRAVNELVVSTPLQINNNLESDPQADYNDARENGPSQIGAIFECNSNRVGSSNGTPRSSNKMKGMKLNNSSHVMQDRPKTQENIRVKQKSTVIQGNDRRISSPKMTREKSQDYQATNTSVLLNKTNQLQQIELRSQISSQDQNHSPVLKAIMTDDNVQDIDHFGSTIMITTPKNGDLPRSRRDRIGSLNQHPQNGIPENHQDQSEFEGMVNRDIKGFVKYSYDNTNVQTGMGELSITSEKETAIDDKILKQPNSDQNFLIQAEIFKKTTVTKMQNLKPQVKRERESIAGAIVNLSPTSEIKVVSVDIIGSGDKNVTRNQHEIKVDTRIDRGKQRHLSPQMRILSKKDGQHHQQRNSRSQNSKRMKNIQFGLQNVDGSDGVLIGTRFKPQIVFKEADLQNLFDKADQPVQQVIEKILLDQLDLFQRFGYAPQTLKKNQQSNSLQKPSKIGTLNSTTVPELNSQDGDHIKYAFIENLLKQRDSEFTSKAMQEMSNLYKGILEDNQSQQRAHKQQTTTGNSLINLEINNRISSQRGQEQINSNEYPTIGFTSAEDLKQSQQQLALIDSARKINNISRGSELLQQLQQDVKQNYKNELNMPKIFQKNIKKLGPNSSMSQSAFEKLNRKTKNTQAATGGAMLLNSNSKEKRTHEQQQISSQLQQSQHDYHNNSQYKNPANETEEQPSLWIDDKIKIDGKKIQILEKEKQKHIEQNNEDIIRNLILNEEEFLFSIRKDGKQGEMMIKQGAGGKSHIQSADEAMMEAAMSVVRQHTMDLEHQMSLSNLSSPKTVMASSPEPIKEGNGSNCQQQQQQQVMLSVRDLEQGMAGKAGRLGDGQQLQELDLETAAQVLISRVKDGEPSKIKSPTQKTQVVNKNTKKGQLTVYNASIGTITSQQEDHCNEDDNETSNDNNNNNNLENNDGLAANNAQRTQLRDDNSGIQLNATNINDHEYQLQLARSKYLSHQANMLNQRKIIVGKSEVTDQKERQKFVEQLFQQQKTPTVTKDLSTQPKQLKKHTISDYGSMKYHHSRTNSVQNSSFNVNKRYHLQEANDDSGQQPIWGSTNHSLFRKEIVISPKPLELQKKSVAQSKDGFQNNINSRSCSSPKAFVMVDDVQTQNRNNIGDDQFERLTQTDNFNRSINNKSNQEGGATGAVYNKAFKHVRNSEQLYNSSPNNKNNHHPLKQLIRKNYSTQTVQKSISRLKSGTVKVKELNEVSQEQFSGSLREHDQLPKEREREEQFSRTAADLVIQPPSDNEDRSYSPILEKEQDHHVRPEEQQLQQPQKYIQIRMQKAAAQKIRGKTQEKNLMNQTTNFERLSSLIDKSSTNERKSKVIAHYKKIKQARKEKKVSSDWRRATPIISTGSTFYKDLFDLRNQVRDESQKVQDGDLKLSIMQKHSKLSALDQLSLSKLQESQQDYENDDFFFSKMLLMNEIQSMKPKISNLLGSNHRKNINKREAFTIKSNAMITSSQQLVNQLLDYKIDCNSHKIGQRNQSESSAFQKKCLVNYILEEWQSSLMGQLKHFDHFIAYTKDLKVSPESKLESKQYTKTTEAYSVVLYGKQTLASICCNQLICFQFTNYDKKVTIHCLEPKCRASKLVERTLNQEIYHTIFTKSSQSSSSSANLASQKVILHSDPKSKSPSFQSHRPTQPALLVKQSKDHKNQEVSFEGLRQRIFLASQKRQRTKRSVGGAPEPTKKIGYTQQKQRKMSPEVLLSEKNYQIPNNITGFSQASIGRQTMRYPEATQISNYGAGGSWQANDQIRQKLVPMSMQNLCGKQHHKRTPENKKEQSKKQQHQIQQQQLDDKLAATKEAADSFFKSATQINNNEITKIHAELNKDISDNFAQNENVIHVAMLFDKDNSKRRDFKIGTKTDSNSIISASYPQPDVNKQESNIKLENRKQTLPRFSSNELSNRTEEQHTTERSDDISPISKSAMKEYQL